MSSTSENPWFWLAFALAATGVQILMERRARWRADKEADLRWLNAVEVAARAYVGQVGALAAIGTILRLGPAPAARAYADELMRREGMH